MFVCRALAGEAARYANAIRELDDVTLHVVSGNPNVNELIEAANNLRPLDKIVTAQETLLAPVAAANEALNLAAMSSEVVSRTLDKSKLKSTLKLAGVRTPLNKIIATIDDAESFVSEVGFPIVVKPLNGSGALTTFRISDDEQLAKIMELVDGPVLAEKFITGEELCFDTVTIANEPQCHSVCYYDPPIIEALENPHKQWRCIMPRDLDPYADFIREGITAVKALQVGNAITHMEGFAGAGFIDATLRPAGARIGPMFGYAFDVDPYRLWARVAVDGVFDAPLERKYAVGTIFLRAAGSGAVKTITGDRLIAHELRDLIVEAKWPKIGVPKSETYTGDGFITVRHRLTSAVQNALDYVDCTIRITYTDAHTPSPDIEVLWKNFAELNRPAWESREET
jgi:hypothetical protein